MRCLHLGGLACPTLTIIIESLVIMCHELRKLNASGKGSLLRSWLRFITGLVSHLITTPVPAKSLDPPPSVFTKVETPMSKGSFCAAVASNHILPMKITRLHINASFDVYVRTFSALGKFLLPFPSACIATNHIFGNACKSSGVAHVIGHQYDVEFEGIGKS